MRVGPLRTRNSSGPPTAAAHNGKDITPKPNHKRQMVSSVFFLDGSTGWVLFSCGDDRDPNVDDVCFELASTTDGGDDWSIVHPKIVDSIPQTDFRDWTGYSGTTYLDFADALHGWAVLKRSLPVGRSAGVMLRTVDAVRPGPNCVMGYRWRRISASSTPRMDG
jgi:hypothetical protein